MSNGQQLQTKNKNNSNLVIEISKGGHIAGVGLGGALVVRVHKELHGHARTALERRDLVVDVESLEAWHVALNLGDGAAELTVDVEPHLVRTRSCRSG